MVVAAALSRVDAMIVCRKLPHCSEAQYIYNCAHRMELSSGAHATILSLEHFEQDRGSDSHET